MSGDEGFWVGADPGGKGNFGVAVLRTDGLVCTVRVSCVDEAIDAVCRWMQGPPAGLGVDAPLWWSSSLSGGRSADRWLRDKYRLSGGQVQAVNSLRGAVLAQGMMFVQRMRECFADVRVTETHPKALLHALDVEEGDFYLRHRVRLDAGVVSEHERDAVISAVAAREGFEERWSCDLSRHRLPSEQDPSRFWLAPIHYFWPDEE